MDTPVLVSDDDGAHFRRVALAWRVTYPRSGAIDVIRAAILDSPLAGVTPVGRS